MPTSTPNNSPVSGWLAIGGVTLTLGMMLCASLISGKDDVHSSEPYPTANAQNADPFAPGEYVIAPSDGFQFELQERLINAVPGDVIRFEAGTYHLHGELNVICDNLTLKGAGSDKTILSFKGQNVGSEGLVATGNGFVIEGLAVEDSVGNAVKVLGANGVIFRDLRTEWTNGPDPENGAYGIYPVQCENVLIEDCVAIGASDAGVYVGQSKNVIVRRCRAEQNVAGIEIENTLNADVYENIATNNTGGLLVFDLPGLQLTNGGNVRVYNNKIYNNNIDNFAPPGNMVATVPAGSGLMIMATDNVEVFDNEIKENQTFGIAAVSFLITQRPIKDPKYDPITEGISIHNNTFEKNGSKPSGTFGKMISLALGPQLPDILYDGIVNPERMVDGKTPPELGMKIESNGEATFTNFNLSMMTPENIGAGKFKPDSDLANYARAMTPLPEVSLAPLPEPPENGNPAVAVYRQTPKHLSEWNLFKGNGSTQEPVDGVMLYDLNTPLFSDYTSKYRFIKLPDGEKMTYQPEEAFDFPVGSLIIKTFSYPHDMRNPEAGEQLLETRIEQHLDSGWYGFTYVWDEAQTDAELKLGGGSVNVSWIHADGEKRTNEYQFPNANQCISCHSQDGKFLPLGPTARNLNRDFAFAHGSANQLDQWAKDHMLADLPTETKDVPKLAQFDHPETGSVADRARAWMDVNCAHCHQPKGTARTTGLDLRSVQTEPAKFGVWKSPVATGRGSGGHKFDIVPGKPDESILLFRLESDEAGIRMPNLARNMNHPESIDLIREWIQSMPVEKPEAGK